MNDNIPPQLRKSYEKSLASPQYDITNYVQSLDFYETNK